MADAVRSDCPQKEYHGNPFRYCPCGWREDQPGLTFDEELRALLNKHGIDARTSTGDNLLASLVIGFLNTVQNGVVLEAKDTCPSCGGTDVITITYHQHPETKNHWHCESCGANFTGKEHD